MDEGYAKMDDTDQALIRALRHDARASLSALSDQLGVSRTTVRARMERLQRQGDIIGFSVVLKGDVAVCKASVVLTEPARRRLIAQFETEVEQQVNGTSAEQRALSLRAAAGTCVADLASAVSETLDRVAQETSPD